MTSLTEILSLLSALIAISDALSCTECISTTSLSCSGPSVTCPSDAQCGSSYTESTLSKVASRILGRNCFPSSLCGINGSITLQEGQVRIVSSCCNTDDCIPHIPPFPTKSYQTNGVVCETCLSLNSTWCNTSDTLLCTGNEDMCLLQTTKTTGSASVLTAFRGCATKSICDLGSHSQSNGSVSTEVKFICTSGGIRVHKAILTPAIACLLLLKSFL